MNPIRVEICVDSLAGALVAEEGGADRVELCVNLFEGGTTPSMGLIKLVKERLTIPVHVLVRPRGGDFLYPESEFAVLMDDIRRAQEAGVDGIVSGCLTSQGDVDQDRLAKMLCAARPLSFTFHRAFDMGRDPRQALEDLITLGVDRLLSSGQEADCMAGAPLLNELQRQATGRIVVMAGGGITPANAASVVARTGVREIHLSARSMIESQMVHRHGRCSMGAGGPPGEFAWKTTDRNLVQAVVSALDRA